MLLSCDDGRGGDERLGRAWCRQRAAGEGPSDDIGGGLRLALLKKRPEIVELCHRIKDDLKRHMMAVYDDTAAIGKLYRRQDEIGTPWCITVDVDSLEDGAVTVRDRDTMAQERVPVEGVTRLILDRLEASREEGGA